MMDIDIERLEKDAAYWDELAIPVAANWAAIKNGSLVGWAEYSMGDESVLNIEMIPRPTKPAASEWVDGVPPVGCECEVNFRTQMQSSPSWHRCEVLKHLSSCAVFYISDPRTVGIVRFDHFRPIRTKAQRDRDDVINSAMRLTCGDDDGKNLITRSIIEQCLAELYDAGMLMEPKP